MGGSSAFIDHADAIGSTTMETDPSGAVQWDVVNGPWGQVWQQTGTRQSQVFAGMDWQVNDPLIPSATREYSDGLGRWMTPDPGGTKVVNLANPQTWNMYAYVTDNPTTLNDPSGLHGNCNSQLSNENSGCEAADPNNVQDSTLVDHGSAKAVNSARKKAAEVAVLATAGCVAAEPCGAAETVATVAVGVVATGYFLYKNKDAIRHVKSQIEVAARHIAKFKDPSHDPNDRGGWRREVQAAIKRAKVWQNRMSPGLWKDAVGALIDQVQSALPGE